MKRFFPAFVLCFSLLLFSAHYSSAANLPVSASCNISCIVEDVVEWSSDSSLSINSENTESENDPSVADASLMLYTNSDVEIIADNSGAALLSDDSRTLSTRYILHYDRAGTELTNSRIVAWNDFDSFPAGLSQVTYIPGDCAVEVILSVNALKNPSNVDKPTFSSPSQTLTVCWK